MNNKKLKIVFMGTPSTACPFLEYLIENEHVEFVVTSQDRPKDRNLEIQFSPVKTVSLKYNQKILQPKNLNDQDFINTLKNISPDLIIVVAYGYKLPKEVINIPLFGAINIHFSLLPKYRGAAPVPWAIINGEKEAGVTSFFINDKMDAGDIILTKKIAIDENDNSETLLNKLTSLGVLVLRDTLNLVKENNVVRIKQDDKLKTLAPKLAKELGLIDWNKSTTSIINKIRGLYPWPGSYSYIGEKNTIIKLFDPKRSDIILDETILKPGYIIKITKEDGLQVKCSDGALWIKTVQLQGKNKMSPYELSLGRKINIGDVFNANIPD